MIDAELLIKLWPLGTAIFGIIAWFIRLESKVTHLKEETRSNEIDHKEEKQVLWSKLDEMQKTIIETNKSIVRIETKLQNFESNK